MSDIKIIKDQKCGHCLPYQDLIWDSFNGKTTLSHCEKCKTPHVSLKVLDLVVKEVKSEVKTEVIKSDERPSKYHLLNVFSHKKYFDWYDLVDAKRASGVIIDPRIERVEKKLFVNDRGHKGYLQDMIESRDQLDMAIEKEELRLKNESD